jgi:16S rRNA (cytidine1402-2'-O)-methyltransferase
MSQAKLYLLPSTLGSESTKAVIPSDVATMVSDFRFFAVEDIKAARRYLRKLDREFPIDDSTFFILKNNTPIEELYAMLRPVKDGNNVAVISDAGCPGIADPGANLVALAHQEGVWVAPLVGPSSILLALMGSGFNGQSFTFHGYLPKDRKDRVRKLRDFEAYARRTGITNIFMDQYGTSMQSLGYVVTLTKGFNDQWTGFIENKGLKNDYYSDGIFTAGAAYLVSSSLQLDASVSRNYKDTPKLLYAGLGASWRFDGNYDEILYRTPKKEKKNF